MTCPACQRHVTGDGAAPCAYCAADLHRKADAELLAMARAVHPLVLAAARANPAGFLAVAEVLASGEAKHPGRGMGPDAAQGVGDHLAALVRHGRQAVLYGTRGLRLDRDSGRPHAAHAAARGILAVQRAAELVMAGEETGR